MDFLFLLSYLLLGMVLASPLRDKQAVGTDTIRRFPSCVELVDRSSSERRTQQMPLRGPIQFHPNSQRPRMVVIGGKQVKVYKQPIAIRDEQLEECLKQKRKNSHSRTLPEPDILITPEQPKRKPACSLEYNDPHTIRHRRSLQKRDTPWEKTSEEFVRDAARFLRSLKSSRHGHNEDES